MSIEQDNILQLKKLCAKVIGGTTTANDVEGATIADILKIITDNYTGTTPQTLGSITVISAEGSTYGTTKITVTPLKGEYSEYRYKIENGTISVSRGDDLSSWTVWDGSSEIVAINGYTIYVAEVDDECKALKGGSTTVISNNSNNLEPLIITSIAGANIGNTLVSVSPGLTQGNYYLYSVTDSDTSLPSYDEKITDMNTWIYWDGSNDISANTGQVLRIIEVTGNGGDLAKKGGYVTVTSHEE